MPIYGWQDKVIKLLMKNHEIRLNCSFPEVNATTFDLYFHDHDRDIDYEQGYKGNFKDTFCHQKGNNNVKKGKGKCENIDKRR